MTAAKPRYVDPFSLSSELKPPDQITITIPPPDSLSTCPDELAWIQTQTLIRDLEGQQMVIKSSWQERWSRWISAN